MAKFSTKAGSALTKVLGTKTLVQISQLINILGIEKNNDEAKTASIEAEAERIMDVERYVDGSEIIDRGPLLLNLTKGLDHDAITRAISICNSVHARIQAERDAWLLEQKKAYEAGEGVRIWEPGWHAHQGPGVLKD